jgi:hypothetical protein
VQRSESGQLISDALVSVAFRPDLAYGSQTTPEFCSPVALDVGEQLQTRVEGFSITLKPRLGAAGIYYSAPVAFPTEGRWQIEVCARSDQGQVTANGTILVSATNGRWRTLWPLCGAPFVLIVVFGGNQWLRMNRLPSVV